MLINSKVGTGTYLLDKEHLPLRTEIEDNEVLMDAKYPTSVEAQEKLRRQRLLKQQRQQVLQMHLS